MHYEKVFERNLGKICDTRKRGLMEEWRVIAGFPRYAVSNMGKVRNEDTGRLMVFQQNQHGNIHVGLMAAGRQCKRSVPLLVARAFVPRPIHQAFDTPINLDGDRWNNASYNLAWRPRWFALKYHHQFHEEPAGFAVPIQEVKSGEIFDNSWHAATKYGLLDREIFTATMNQTYVWPTYQVFRTVA